MTEKFDIPEALVPTEWRWGKAWVWLRKYNALSSLEMPRFIKKRLGACGSDVTIRAGFFCEKGNRIFLGNNVSINFGCKLMDVGNITIGDNCAIAPGVTILTADHIDGRVIVKDVVIGNNVYIGANATILAGVTIEDNATVGACSLVTHDVPAGVLVKGIPARGETK